MSWIDGMGQDFHRRVVFKVAGNGEQVFGHHGADGGTTGKKEVSYINLALECFIGYPVTVLVYEAEVGNRMVDRIGANDFFLTIYSELLCGSVKSCCYSEIG